MKAKMPKSKYPIKDKILKNAKWYGEIQPISTAQISEIWDEKIRVDILPMCPKGTTVDDVWRIYLTEDKLKQIQDSIGLGMGQ